MNYTTINPETTTLGEIVAGDYNAAGVFRRYGLDFCCGGGLSLVQACKKRNIKPEILVAELEQLQSTELNGRENFKAWEPGFLIEHIIETHHRFVREKSEEIAAYAMKVARVHGERYPENIEIYRLFCILANELTEHLREEEQSVFPIITTVFEKRTRGEHVPARLIDELASQLNNMEEDHEKAGEWMKEIRELSNGFTPPADACATYRVLYQNLEAFEKNLHKHVHLENNILFKKAETLLP